MRRTTRFISSTLGAIAVTGAAAAAAAVPRPAVAGSSGFAVDGYLRIFYRPVTATARKSQDSGETTTSSDSSGFFKFSTPCTAMPAVTGGTSVDTNLPFTASWKARAGSTVVTPLTSLLAEGMTIDQANAAFGLPAGTDIKNADPAKVVHCAYRTRLYRKTLVLQQLIQKTTSCSRAWPALGDAAVTAIYSEVAAEWLRPEPIRRWPPGPPSCDRGPCQGVRAAGGRVGHPQHGKSRAACSPSMETAWGRSSQAA